MAGARTPASRRRTFCAESRPLASDRHLHGHFQDGAMGSANAELYERLQREFGARAHRLGRVSSLEDVASCALGLCGP